ncbi:MAG: hypothetical protein RR234_03230 [Christensenella sp.]
MGKREDAWKEKLECMTAYERAHWERGEMVAGRSAEDRLQGLWWRHAL